MADEKDMDRDNGVAVATELGQPLFPGLTLYTPVPQDLQSIKSPAAIIGSDFHQMLQISLAPGEVITAEPGTMNLMSGGLDPNVDVGDLSAACTRCCFAGAGFFRLVFENKTSQNQFIALSAPAPGKIIPLPLDRYSGFTLTKGAFLAAYGKDWTFSLKFTGNIAAGLFGGQGFVLTEIGGSGTAFITASGTVEMLELADGEQMIVEQDSLVGFEKGVKYDVRAVQSCLVCCCSGMGLFHALLTGPGLVIVQSLPMKRLAKALRLAGAGGRQNNNDNNNNQN